MRVMLIPRLLCTAAVWGDLNDLHSSYKCHNAMINFRDSISGISQCIREEMKGWKGDWAIIGFSMGGYIAIDIAIHLRAGLRKLVLINTTAKSVDPASVCKREKSIALVKEGKFNTIVKTAHEMCFYKPTVPLKRLMQSMAKQTGAENYVTQQRAIIGRKSYDEQLSKISSETLIISSLEDKIISCRDSFSLLEKIPNASLVMLKHCGHMATLEKADEVKNHVVNFLEN